MKSWKEQLRGIKTALRGSGKQKGGDKPSAVEFEPPESWSTGNRAIPKGVVAHGRTPILTASLHQRRMTGK